MHVFLYWLYLLSFLRVRGFHMCSHSVHSSWSLILTRHQFVLGRCFRRTSQSSMLQLLYLQQVVFSFECGWNFKWGEKLAIFWQKWCEVGPKLLFITSRRRRRRYLFGSNNITYSYTNDKIKQISRARLSENPEVIHAGHPNIQFLVYHETTTTTTILLKTHKETNTEKSDRWWAVD